MAQQVTPATTTKPAEQMDPQAANQTTANTRQLNSANPTDATLNANANATAANYDNTSNIGVGGAYVADLVEDRMTGLLSKDNSYMQMNRAQAAQQANSRGLLNTSIAAGAGQAAAIQGALPIASQDSSAVNQFRYIQQEGDINAAIQGSANAATLAAAQIRNQGALDLAEAQAGYDVKSALQQQGFDLDRMEAQFGYNDSLADKEINAAMGRLEFQNDADMSRAFGDNLTDIGQQHQQSRAAILAAPEMSYGVKQQELVNEDEGYIEQVRMLSSFYGQPVDIELFPDAGVYDSQFNPNQQSPQV